MRRCTNAPGKVGRITQTWVRFDEGWRIVVGHVSVIEEPASYGPGVSLPLHAGSACCVKALSARGAEGDYLMQTNVPPDPRTAA